MKGSIALPLVSLSLAAFLSAGCGKGSDCGLKKAGEKVEDALKIKINVERQTPFKAELSADAKAAGLSMNIARPLPQGENAKAGFCAYVLTADKSLSGQLLAKALDKKGMEIGRAVCELEMGKDDARYFNFWFQPEMDSRKVDSFVIDYKK
jgi:glycine cleavage system regulatory protein